jgi:hypothetical protein
MYFSLFINDTVNWDNFVTQLRDYFRLNCAYVDKFKQELANLIHRRFCSQGKKVVLLFDELTKIDNP